MSDPTSAAVPNLLDGGHNIRTVEKLLSHRKVSTTMIYTHILNRGRQRGLNQRPGGWSSTARRLVIDLAGEGSQPRKIVPRESAGFGEAGDRTARLAEEGLTEPRRDDDVLLVERLSYFVEAFRPAKAVRDYVGSTV